MALKDWFLLLALSVLWGGSFLFVGIAVHEVPPLTIVASRVVIAAIVLPPVLWLAGLRLPRRREVWLAFLGMGILNNAIPFTLITWGQSQLPSGLASIFNATTPLATAVAAHILTRDEKLTVARTIGALLGLAGVTVMMGSDLLSGQGYSLSGQIACLAAPWSYACAAIFGRRFSRMGVPPLVTAHGQLVGSSLVLLPLALAVDRPWQMAMPSLLVMAALAALALVSTAFAYVIFFRVMTTAGTNVYLVTLLVPVSAMVFGVLLLGESLSLRHLAGFAIIAAGLASIDGRVFRLLRGLAARRV